VLFNYAASTPEVTSRLTR